MGRVGPQGRGGLILFPTKVTPTRSFAATSPIKGEVEIGQQEPLRLRLPLTLTLSPKAGRGDYRGCRLSLLPVCGEKVPVRADEGLSRNSTFNFVSAAPAQAHKNRQKP
jgi:hypothetical protein